MNIRQVNSSKDKKKISKKILESLPQWFGIPESTEEYIRESANMPFFIVGDVDDAIGFIAIKENSKFTCEIYVMGVLSNHHKLGIGKGLIHKAIEFANEVGYEFIQVKTLDESHSDANYAKTRKFYEAMGFKKLETIPEIWGKENPCLILIQSIKN